MSAHRPLLGSLPSKLKLGFLGAAVLLGSFRYATDGPTEATNVILFIFLLLWLVAWGYSELHRSRIQQLRDEYDLPEQHP